jgi:SpoVK/Ycf46/Vps4 family AAA+-type ATPase
MYHGGLHAPIGNYTVRIWAHRSWTCGTPIPTIPTVPIAAHCKTRRKPMSLERVQAVFKQEMARTKQRAGRDVTGNQRTLDTLLRHMVGLPDASVRHLVRLALGDGQITTADLTRVLQAKQEAIGAAELLVFEQRLLALADVAGMAALKRWMQVRREPFLNPEGTGLPAPRGMLLLGVQGGGKSLMAKATAAAWQVPLFRMDFGALYDKYQGESERKLREALRAADAMAPCVLWMDEIEKGLAGGGGGSGGGATSGDTGTSQRLLGSLLTRMAERSKSVFLVATANDIEGLPPELLRKGRFDEIFFIDLPAPAARADILRLHLARHKVVANDTDVAQLVALTEGYSGAELEAAVVAARYEAHAQSQPAHASMVHSEVLRTKPLSVTRAEALQALREWASARAAKAE